MKKNYTPSPAHCRIFLRKIRISCFIGIDQAETEVPQQLLLDVEITPEALPAADTPAVNYAAVLHCLQTFAAGKRHDLLENFALQAATAIMNEFAVAAVRLYCCKPHPFANLGEAGAEVRLEK